MRKVVTHSSSQEKFLASNERDKASLVIDKAPIMALFYSEKPEQHFLKGLQHIVFYTAWLK